MRHSPLPPTPAQGQRPWFDERDAFDSEVRDRLKLTADQALTLGADDSPLVTKPLTSPVIEWEDQTAESMYWPWLVDLSQDGIGTGWAWFWSSDHAAVHANSGIWAATGPTPFEVTAQLGRVYRDDTSGNQTETPSIIWDPAVQLWRIYYQQAGVTGARAEQVTLMATAAPGQLTTGPWTRVGIIIDAGIASPIPGALKHQGYFRPAPYAGSLYGFNLSGGSNYGGQQQQRSYDGGASWSPAGRVATQGPHLRAALGYDPLTWVTNWTWGNLFDWRGTPWVVVPAGAIASGTDDPPPRRIMVGPMGPDLRRPASTMRDVTPPAQAWETNAIDSVGNLVDYQGRMIMPYRSNLHQGAFSILEVV